MSEELEWELYDIFEAGLFAFPLYEHQTARRIIRYLMYRGVLTEEIADAIEVRHMEVSLLADYTVEVSSTVDHTVEVSSTVNYTVENSNA